MSRKHKIVLACGIGAACALPVAAFLVRGMLHSFEVINDAPASGTAIPEPVDEHVSFVEGGPV